MAKKRTLWVGHDFEGPFISLGEPKWDDENEIFAFTSPFGYIDDVAIRLLLGVDDHPLIFAKQIIVDDGAWEIEYVGLLPPETYVND